MANEEMVEQTAAVDQIKALREELNKTKSDMEEEKRKALLREQEAAKVLENLKEQQQNMDVQKDALQVMVKEAGEVKAAQISTRDSLREAAKEKHLKRFKTPATKRMLTLCFELEWELEDLVDAWQPFFPPFEEIHLIEDFESIKIQEEDVEEVTKTAQITATILAAMVRKIKAEKGMQEVAATAKSGWGAVGVLEGKEAKFSGSVEEQEELQARAKKADEEYLKLNPVKRKKLTHKRVGTNFSGRGRGYKRPINGGQPRSYQDRNLVNRDGFIDRGGNRGRGGRARGAGNKSCFRCHATGNLIGSALTILPLTLICKRFYIQWVHSHVIF